MSNKDTEAPEQTCPECQHGQEWHRGECMFTVNCVRGFEQYCGCEHRFSARVDPPAAPAEACVECGHDRDDPRRRGKHPDDFNTTFCIYGCGCQCRFSPALDQADKALEDRLWEALKQNASKKPDEAKLIVFLSEKKFRDAIGPTVTAALAQARKEGAQGAWETAIRELCTYCAEGDAPVLDGSARWYYHGEDVHTVGVGCSASKLRFRQAALESASKQER